ncbi:Golgi transport complex subunit 4 [Apophysomyces ossiformis]|uniref:Conserved oligomeric Golgi complex subunit 4 n=1 Tax=Apophysomyces ossiformis TaxID=679940 RepID=A0A8H7BVN9_9FUNG|nr:Golgi transport complex subunit 4 [Apophysomyces ossiformis]
MPSAVSSTQRETNTIKESSGNTPNAQLDSDTAQEDSWLSQNLDSLTNIDDIRESLRLLDDEETRIDASLDRILSEKQDMQDALGTLDTLKPLLCNLKNSSSQMLDTIYQTSLLAENISDKVRQLDQEQSRAKEAIKYVEDVQELKHCILGIQQAMHRKDYDEAAGLLQRASYINPAVLQGTLAEFTVVGSRVDDDVAMLNPTSENPDHPVKTLADTKAALFSIFSQRFDDAVAERNEMAITRDFKLFPLIGCQTEGLDKYSRFVCNIIKARCAEELRMADVSLPTYFADALTRLFENIAVIIDQHQPFVETHYGRGKMLRIIQRLQEESDTQSGNILDRFVEQRKLSAKTKTDAHGKLIETQSLNIAMVRATAAGRPPNAAAPTSPILAQNTNELVDPRQLDANLLELALISQRSALFHIFLNERADDEMEYLGTDDQQQAMVMNGKDRRFYGTNGLLISSGLTKRIKELLTSYLIIDEYLLKQSMDKAMKLDHYDPSSGQTSTCVDDVFFILKKVVKRSISTYEPEVISSTIGAVMKGLDSSYMQQFRQKMSSAFAGYDNTARAGDRSIDQAKINYMVVLNNLDVSADYTKRLAEEMKPDVATGMWKNADSDTMLVNAELDKLQSTSKNFEKLLKNGMEQLHNQTLKPWIRPLFQGAYREVKYVLEEDEYNEADIEELFVKRFRHSFDSMINLYRDTLTESNFGILMGLVIDAVTIQWERIVLQTRFNQYGALRFDKDLRAVIHYVSVMTESFSRDRFTRLTQMATLLNFEEPSEIYDYWGAKAGPVSWRLTVAEVKKILALRVNYIPARITSESDNEIERPNSCIASLDLVCPPDQWTGRKKNILTPAATKGLAELYNIPVHHTPPGAKTLDGWDIPRKYDLGIVVSFGYFIPSKIIATFEKGAINVHPSLLPRFRGAAPIQHTILSGDNETGVTIQELDDKEFDAGRILAQQKVDLSQDAAPRFKDLRDRLAIVGQHMLIDTLRNFEKCKSEAKPQNPDGITKAPKIKKEWSEVDFSVMESWQIEQLHRAIGEQYPLRTIFTFSRIKRSKKIKQKYIQMQMVNIFLPEDSPIYDFEPPLEPGAFIFDDKSSTLHVACADGNAIAFTHIKADSKDTITVKDFVNGYEIHGGLGQFGILGEDYVEPGKSGVRVTKRRHEYAKSIRKRLGMRRFEYDYHYQSKTSGRR